MTTPYTSAIYNSNEFNCPLCGAFSDQEWLLAEGKNKDDINHRRPVRTYSLPQIEFSKCSHCKKSTIWLHGKMIYPLSGNIPLPNPDLPTDVQEDYKEASEIVNHSSRGAAALLRLAIQKICKNLGESGENINNDIANLVKKGLPKTMQKALDSVRVIGNNAVHPGQIDLKDDIETAHKLFGFVNIICEVMISQPKQIDEFYNLKVPQNIKDAIDKRDSKKN